MAEFGELIVKSYLKNVKKCEMVELNWKLQNKNEEDIKQNLKQNQDVMNFLEILKDNIKSINSKNNEGPTIEFNNFENYNCEDIINKLINQVEIDVVGYSKEGGYFLSEVAMQTDRLNYGAKTNTVEHVQKKLLRLLILFLGYFNGNKGEINLVAIKSAKDDEQKRIDDFVKIINLILEKIGLKNIKIKMILDDDFYKMYKQVEESISSRSINEFERLLNIEKAINKNKK
ncbi:MAG: hypothetical protein ILA02_06270 [Clostridia bacterium]|nr:hypothetical protein [Clostridia bacterium]